MTWKELKDHAEQAGVTDETELEWVNIEAHQSPTDVTVRIEDNKVEIF